MKRSSAFLSSLTHSAARIRASKLDESHLEDSYCNENTCSIRHSPLRGYLSILSKVTNDLEPFRRRSSSVQTLPVVERRRRSGARVKKSVSFSSDTSFEEKRLPYRRVAAVHEVKVYHKGVLQGIYYFRSFLSDSFASETEPQTQLVNFALFLVPARFEHRSCFLWRSVKKNMHERIYRRTE